ncbi:MAG: DUF1801 domain-containing protein [Deltaproteobacteria bacterium]|nr:DUF1801 domain-containing protein [Deltaproteobacteria bacterium]
MRPAPAELKRFLAAYDASIGTLFLAGRAAVLAAAPSANELIYDAYNAVSAAYSFSPRLQEAFCHVAAYAGHVNLGFNRGAALPDPDGLLAGSGARIRHIRIGAASDLEQPGVQRLLCLAVEEGRAAAAAAAPTRGRAAGASTIRPTHGAKRRPAAKR